MFVGRSASNSIIIFSESSFGAQKRSVIVINGSILAPRRRPFIALKKFLASADKIEAYQNSNIEKAFAAKQPLT